MHPLLQAKPRPPASSSKRARTPSDAIKRLLRPTAGWAGLVLLLAGCEAPAPPPTAPGQPLAGLTPEQREQFEAGRRAFQQEFTPETGLGPLFNSVSCAECHEDPVVGGAGDEVEVHATRSDPQTGCDPLFQEGGHVIQQDATPLLRALGVAKEEIPSSATAQARRSSPPLFGLGLVDAIPDATILAREDPTDADRDGISGRANRTIDGRLGRFGRKAAVATLFDFNVGAYLDEMGVTTPPSPVESTINGRPVPPGTDPQADPELAPEGVELATAFVRFLAPPPPQAPADPAGREQAVRGREIFTRLNCAVCHVPEMATGPGDIPALDRKTVALFSDLLLHDMGPELADICLGQAQPGEFRTEMLMGLRLREFFLHDGSAATVTEAIERHGGEAARARDGFRALNEADRAALLKFLDTL